MWKKKLENVWYATYALFGTRPTPKKKKLRDLRFFLKKKKRATGGGGDFNLRVFFLRMTKIKGVKNWYCSLEMKEKFGMRPLAAAS